MQPPQKPLAPPVGRAKARLLRLLQESEQPRAVPADGVDAAAAENAEAENEQFKTALQKLLAEMHAADIADALESLPLAQRAIVWRAAAQTGEGGQVLLETGENARDFLLAETPAETMAALLGELPGEEVAELLRRLPPAQSARLMRLAGLSEDAEVRASLSFDEGAVGALMDFQPVLAREEETVGDLRARLQKMGELPSHCDKLFVVDAWERLAGVLPLKRLLLHPPQTKAKEITVGENLYLFRPGDDVEKAAGAFERYDLISAPVVDDSGRVIGRITIDEIVEHMHESRERGLLSSAGIREEEDLFAPLPRRFRNRWQWIFINLLAALLISRVVGVFEGAIAQLAALASLMPVVANMSGNIGNQTATLTIRALALDKINALNWREILRGEFALSLINGIVWGGIVGVFVYAIYNRAGLAIVITVSMIVCFIAAALAGFAIPLIMRRLNKDPALGATVVLSGAIDTLGFFVFLSLGLIFLL